jgi:hypothetical protein
MSWVKRNWIWPVLGACILIAFAVPRDADAQSSPGFVSGQTLTAGQLNAAFASKADLANALLTGALQKTNNLSDLTSVTLARSHLGLGTAAVQSIGTSGANVPLLNGANTWSAVQAINLNTASLPTPVAGSGLIIGAADTVAARLQLESFGAVSNFSATRADGTAASPTQVLSGEQIGGFNAYAYGSGAWQGPIASIRPFAGENIDSTHHGSQVCIATTPMASTTLANGFCQAPTGGVTVGTPTLGERGAGSLNASTLYVNGAAVSTAALQSYATGSWTPTFEFQTAGSSSVAYTQQYGKFTCIGGQVYVAAQVAFTPTNGSASGAVLIGGLPYTTLAASRGVDGGSVTSAGSNFTGYTGSMVTRTFDASHMAILQTTSGSGTNVLTPSNVNTGGANILAISATYNTASGC